MSAQRRSLFLILLLSVSALLFAGGSGEKPEEVLKIGLLPDADSLPFLVAREEGLFSDAGAAVELLMFQNPVERDAAFQAGQIDGIIADTIGSILLFTGGMDVRIASITTGRYGLAAAPGSDARSPADLAGKEIGGSSNTVIEYVASSLLREAGVPDSGFKPLAVPKIPVRMELLLNGKLSAACLPEPLYALAVARGAVPLGDSKALGMDPGVMLFAGEVLRERSDELVRVYRAYWEACRSINADPDAYRDFLVDVMGFPPVIKESFSFVEYEYPRLPDPQEIVSAADWMIQRGMIEAAPVYEALCFGTLVEELEQYDPR
jgi:NitT/TauT family transport system substrate-binding protein